MLLTSRLSFGALNRMNSQQRLAAMILAGALIGATVATLVHLNRSPHREKTTREGKRRDPSPAGFTVGVPLGDLMLTAPDGQRQPLLSIAKESAETVLHFVDRECPACMRDLHNWGSAAGAAQVPVLFVACNESAPLQQLEGLGEPSTNLYTLVRQDHASRGPRVVPLTIVVDRRGTIVGGVPGLRDFVLRWHG